MKNRLSNGFTTALLVGLAVVGLALLNLQRWGTFGSCTGIWIGSRDAVALYYDQTPSCKNLCFVVWTRGKMKPDFAVELLNFR